jgi:hypothetical protein
MLDDTLMEVYKDQNVRRMSVLVSLTGKRHRRVLPLSTYVRITIPQSLGKIC